MFSQCLSQSSVYTNGSMQYDATVPADMFNDGSPSSSNMPESLSSSLDSSFSSLTPASLSCNTQYDFVEGLLDTENAFPILNLDEESVLNGITGDEMSSLLEQFENVTEKSMAASDPEAVLPKIRSSPNITATTPKNTEPKRNNVPEDSEVMKLLKASKPPKRLTVSAPSTPSTSPPPDILHKIRSNNKRNKSTIMLQNIPSKSGKGVELPSKVSPRRLQKSMSHNPEPTTSASASSQTKAHGVQSASQLIQTLMGSMTSEPRTPTAVQVDEQYFKRIADHDYACNAPPIKVKVENTAVSSQKKISRLTFGKQFVLKRGNNVVMSTEHLKPQSKKVDSGAIDESMLKSLLLNNKLIEKMKQGGTGFPPVTTTSNNSRSSSPSSSMGNLILPPLPYSQPEDIPCDSSSDDIGKCIPNPFAVLSTSSDSQSIADDVTSSHQPTDVSENEIKNEPSVSIPVSSSHGDSNVKCKTGVNLKIEPMDISETDGESEPVLTGQASDIEQPLGDPVSSSAGSIVDNSDSEEKARYPQNERFVKKPTQSNHHHHEQMDESRIIKQASRFSKRIYRRKHPETKESTENLYDKLPDHYTVLSKPINPSPMDRYKNPVSKVMSSSHRLPNHDRDPSPEPSDDATFSKLPSYVNSFTDSNRYDNQIISDDTPIALPPGACKSDPLGLNSAPASRESSPIRNSSFALMKSNVSCPGSRTGSPLPSSRLSSKSHQQTLRAALVKTRNRRSRNSSSSSRSRSRSRSRYQSKSRYSSSRSSHRRSRRKRRSYSSSRSSSRSNSRSRSRSPLCQNYSRSTSRSPYRYDKYYSSPKRSIDRSDDEDQRHFKSFKRKEKDERRIVYVGKIDKNCTRRDLRRQFSQFGEILDVSVHFREGNGDNYGFVTFALTCDAFHAIENGNKKRGLENYDLCFGGRRQFCGTNYEDLDGNAEIEEEIGFSTNNNNSKMDFDELLRAAQRKIKR